jgi:hypothetical protein
MNQILAFLLILTIASVRDISAESNLRAAGNSNSVVSHSQRRELSWWGSFYYNLFPHSPSGSGSSSTGSGSGSGSGSSSNSGSSNADGSAESGADADADAPVEDVDAESDGGWNLSFEDVDGWQASYATIDGSESKSFGAGGAIMMVMAAMLVGAAMFTYWVRSAYTGWSFSIIFLASTHDVVSAFASFLLFIVVGHARAGETHARRRGQPGSRAPRGKDHRIRRNRERAD